MLRRLISSQGKSYLVLGKNAPILKWVGTGWTKWEPKNEDKFWRDVESMYHFKERGLTEEMEVAYDEATLL